MNCFRLATISAILTLHLTAMPVSANDMPWIQLGAQGQDFVLEPSGEPFTPWGFNYDHDGDGRLLEDYWHEEWDRVEQDFKEMKQLGANVVRIHLQFNRFMKSPDEPNDRSLCQLERLLDLAKRTGLYLDITGLGCYHAEDTPAWYDEMQEEGRWAAQAAFWEAVAKRCSDSPAVFCYDLMNEPVVPGPRGHEPGNWLGPEFADSGKHFVQFITLDPGERPRWRVAQQWIESLTGAIRKYDEKHLITVGLVPWSLDRPGLTSGFVPGRIADQLDFLAVHLYPEKGKVDEAIETLAGFDVGKPLVIEETFPLKAGFEDQLAFMRRSREYAEGWISFYWGSTEEISMGYNSPAPPW